MKYVKTIRKANGSTFRYLAVPGRALVRLPDGDMGSSAFLRAYAEAMATAEKPARKAIAASSIAAAILAYQKSDAFRLSLAASTQETRRRILSKIADKWGSANLADLRTPHIEADLAGLPPHAAKARLKVWRGFCEWCKDARRIPKNYAKTAESGPVPQSSGHAPWSAADIKAFREHWPIGTPQRLAMELVYWTAARASDAVRLGPGMIDRRGWLTFRQVKTGGEVSIPFDRTLPDFAQDMAGDLVLLKQAIAQAPRHMTWLVTEQGGARSVKAFSQWLSGAAAAAGVEGKSAHGLRKARAIAIAEEGATTHQIAAWTGHETLGEVERYAKGARKRRLLSGTTQEQKLETEADPVSKTAK